MAQKKFYLVRRSDRLTRDRGGKKRPTYYVRFRDTDGTLCSWRSTKQTAKTAAENWVLNEIGKEKTKRSSMTFGAYAAGFWEPNSAFVQQRASHGYAYSHGYLDIAESNTRNHLIPAWGARRLREITPGGVNQWVVRLYRKGKPAPATINKLLQTLRTVLGQAVEDGYLSENPAAFVKPVKTERPKRGILTPAEVVTLLAGPDLWADYRHFAVNLFALTTGARMGECRGLLVENVKADHVEIRHSWEEGYGLKAPKYNSARDVPISERVAEALARVVRETQPESIIFFGTAARDRPMTKSCIEKNLYKALARIGISDAERRTRGICFHSHRHLLNTLLRSRGVADSKVRQIVGHQSVRMSDYYTHYRATDFAEVVAIQEDLFGGRQ